MTSLENQLETAYAAVAKANEPGLANVTPRLSTLILAQAPAPDAPADDAEAAQTNEQVPVSSVTFKATRSKNSIPGRPYYDVELLMEARANARDGSDTGALDILFNAMIRPLRYTLVTNDTAGVTGPFPQILGTFVDNLVVKGMPDRGETSDLSFDGQTVMRSMRATFICGSPNP